MTDYPKELWLVCRDGDIIDAMPDHESAVERAACYGDAMIARVTPEWKKPEEQK